MCKNRKNNYRKNDKKYFYGCTFNVIVNKNPRKKAINGGFVITLISCYFIASIILSSAGNGVSETVAILVSLIIDLIQTRL